MRLERRKNMTIHYEELNGKNFNTYSLDHFVRHQQVSECWRNVDGQWKLIPIEFEENWSVEQCRKIAADVALHMENDQTAIGAFDGEEVIGFITVSQHTLQGKVRQHIKRLAVYMPRKSTGNWRKKNHAMCSLNMFLYKKMELLEVV